MVSLEREGVVRHAKEDYGLAIISVECLKLGEFAFGCNEKHSSSTELASPLEIMHSFHIVSLPLFLLVNALDLVDLFIDIFLGLPLGPALPQQRSRRKVNHHSVGSQFTDIMDQHSIGTHDLVVVVLVYFPVLE